MLDEVIVPVASTAKSMADLKGKRVGSGPGIQNVTLAKTVLERGGATGATVVELPIGQHVAALAAGQLDGCYTLEPTGTIGRLNGTTQRAGGRRHRQVRAGRSDGAVVRRLGLAHRRPSSRRTPPKPRSSSPPTARVWRTCAPSPPKPASTSRATPPSKAPLTSEVPLAAYMMYDEFKPADVAHFQKFFDLFSEKGIFTSRLMVDSMLYKG